MRRFLTAKRDTRDHRIRGVFTQHPGSVGDQVTRALAARGFADVTESLRGRHRRRPILQPSPNTRVFQRGPVEVSVYQTPAGALFPFLSIVGMSPRSNVIR